MHLRVAQINARSVTLVLDLGQGTRPRGYGLVLRYPQGVEIQNPGLAVQNNQGDRPSSLGGVLRQTEERVFMANYNLEEVVSPGVGSEIELHFTLPPGVVGGEIRLEELWTVDDNQQISRFATDAAVGLVPQVFSLASPYPNPFNPAVQIPYSLPERAAVKLQVYNVLGQQVQTLVNETQEAGFYQLAWQGLDNQGEAVASGLYFIHLEAGAVSKIQKVVLMK